MFALPDGGVSGEHALPSTRSCNGEMPCLHRLRQLRLFSGCRVRQSCHLAGRLRRDPCRLHARPFLSSHFAAAGPAAFVLPCLIVCRRQPA